MNDDDMTPRVWIGSLAAYNAGSLLGDWFDLDEAPADSVEWAQAMIDRGRFRDRYYAAQGAEVIGQIHEEIWAFDDENMPFRGEYGPLEWAEAAERYSDIVGLHHDQWAAYLAYCEIVHVDTSGLPEMHEFDDALCGEYDSERDYADELADELLDDEIALEESLARRYFDYEAFARDLFMMDFHSVDAPGGGVYVFRSV